MSYLEALLNYIPTTRQEEQDKQLMVDYIKDYGDQVLTRDNRVAHLTASSVIVNEDVTQMLMIYHKIYDTWTWTGGHMDGDRDFLEVALKEAMEETGLKEIRPVTNDIASVDVLTVEGHMKHGDYVSAHLHLNVAYVFVARDKDALVLNEEETAGLAWVPIEEVEGRANEPTIYPIYRKLFDVAAKNMDPKVFLDK